MGIQIHLASPATCIDIFKQEKVKYALETYYRFDNKKELSQKDKDIIKYLKSCKHYLLDSGAFTFITGTKKKTVKEMDEYVHRYAEFIKTHGIKYYFEMDVDEMGLDNVERWRKYLETYTGVKCIPVWHYGRGFDYWEKMIREYDYVSIGGIVGSGLSDELLGMYRKMVISAHRNNCKVHGLGFTSLKKLEYVGFDTVDSTSWLSGAKYGVVPELKKDGTLKATGKKVKQTATSKELFTLGIKLWKKVIEIYD